MSQLYYWRESSLVPGLVVNKEKKTKGFYSTSEEPSGILSDLVPFSQYKMFMVVANSRFEGPPSNTVEFTTKEGGEEKTASETNHATSKREICKKLCLTESIKIEILHKEKKAL